MDLRTIRSVGFRPKLLLFIAVLCLVPLLAACGESGYEETFDNAREWELEDDQGVRGSVVDDTLHLTIDLPESLYYTTMGRRNMEDGVFEVDVTPVAGSAESAYGLVFRATPNATDFYYFLISVDGFYSIGGCQNGCLDGDLIRIADNMWTQSELIQTGLNATHTLRVDAVGEQLTYYINGQQLGQFSNATLPKGDIGILLQTFDSAATVSFDNLRFTPAEDAGLAVEGDA